MKQPIATAGAPAAIGPYSQAVEAGGCIYVSGQLPINPATGQMAEGGVAELTRQSLANIRAILAEAGLGMENVVKTTCYLKSMDDFALFNDIYGQYFVSSKPARSCFQVAKLPKDGLVEIEVVAAR